MCSSTQAEELQTDIVPKVNSLGSRVGGVENLGGEHANALSNHSEEIRRRAKITQIEALQTAVKNLMTMMQGNQGADGGGGRGKKGGGGKSAAGSYRCIVCDSVSTPTPTPTHAMAMPHHNLISRGCP